MPDQNTVTFELPVGYKDDKGTTHTTVTMRPLTGRDEMAIAGDIEMREMASEPIDFVSTNPAVWVLTRVAMKKIQSILYSQVVLSIGSIERPRRDVFRDFCDDDMAAMEEQYAILNNLKMEDLQRFPFVAGGSLLKPSRTRSKRSAGK